MANIKWSKEAAATVVGFCIISFVLDMNSLLPRFTDEFTAEHISLRRSLSSSSSIANNENGIDIDIDIDSYHRYLFAEPTTNDENENDVEVLIHGDTDLYTMMATLAANDDTTTSTTEISSSNRYTAQLPQYTLEDALKESTIWEYTFCLLIYNPPTDKFIALYNKDSIWNVENRKRLHIPVTSFTYLLRQTFPERFMGSKSSELVIPIGAGDYPHIIPQKLRQHLDNNGVVAPVLMFGSAFRDSTKMYPNMIPMPMPEVHHLGCFVDWIESGKERVCEALTDRSLNKEMNDLLEWDDLIPQVIWRGNDYGYLPTLSGQRFLKSRDTEFKLGSAVDKQSAIHSLNDQFDKLLPRWKGVALTADAEFKAEGTDKLPWANIKLSTFANGGKPTLGDPRYAKWDALGIPMGEYMNTQEQAKYKYQIDLGGCGGTTWTGTINKLAMPGLLFHHVTPMKDYIHDHLKPWKHYIPVSASLHDLKQKYDWAESHPTEAKRIADAATDFMRELGTHRGFGTVFDQDFVEPMRRVIEAYVPVSKAHHRMSSWRELLDSLGVENHRQVPIMECSGESSSEANCQLVGGDTMGGKASPLDDSWWDGLDHR